MRHVALLARWLGCMCALSLSCGALARADVFSPVELVSARPVELASGTFYEQAEAADQSAISGDKHYAVFVGAFGGQPGIWRRDLESGAVEQVAPGAPRFGAERPSISADGRYVSFTTDQRLAPEDDRNGNPDVYVRDMSKPCQLQDGNCLACAEHQDAVERAGCPFILVSAVDGSSEGATYEYPKPAEEPFLGSYASGRSAISADGRYVAFETTAESNLIGAHTPPLEVLVRDLETDQTSLVSSEYDAHTGADTGVPVALTDGVGAAYPPTEGFGGASISADGSTVAWLGQDIGRQARLLSGEQASYEPLFNEPLWRRIDEGPSSPTRRVTGGSDPESPACLASAETRLPLEPNPLDPCQGPFALYNRETREYVLSVAGENFVPQLSADGDTVAFLASAPQVGTGEQFSNNETSADLFISEMSGSLSRVQALHRLTLTGTDASDVEQAASIVDLAISPDGSQVAFVTRRTEFPLGIPSYVSSIAAQAGITELFDADLADETITRVTHGYLGEAIPGEQSGSLVGGGGASSPSFDEDGDALSFSSAADNLVYGDGNDAADAFLVERVDFAEASEQQYVSSPPPPPAPSPSWRLYATAEPQPDGTVRLDVSVPAAGDLSVAARATVPVKLAVSKLARTRAHGRRASGVLSALLRRGVASTHAAIPAAGDGLEQLTLTLAQPYRALAQRSEGLYAAITLRFTASGHPSLSTGLNVTFKRRQLTREPAHRPRKRRGRR